MPRSVFGAKFVRWLDRRSFLTFVAVVVPALLNAQTVRGVVVDRGGIPVSGVLATLIDSTMAVVSRSLSNERGEFILRAGRPGPYAIRSLRIGYRQMISPTVHVGLNEFITSRIVLDDVRFQLETIRVAAKTVCEVRAESAVQTFALWEQARAALSAAALNAGAQSLVATTVHYDRVLERSGPRIVEQIVSTSTGVASQQWQTLPVDSLVKNGHVTVANDMTTYLAPGLDLLASDAFLLSHCLRLVPAADSSRIGIAFEPVRERRGVAEIRGTLWIDRASVELRQVEFGFTNIPREQARRAGGDVRFIRLANGAWAISRWNISMPVFTRRKMPTGFYDPELILAETRVSGGELSTITSVSLNGVDTLWSHEPLVMRGIVTDSLSGAVVVGARVELVGTKFVGVTNASGEFAISGVLPGVYDADVRSPVLSEIGVVSRSSVAFLDSGVNVALRVASRSQLVAALCPRTRLGRNGLGEGVIMGTLLAEVQDQRVANVRMVVGWRIISVRGGSAGVSVERPRRYIESHTDSLGAFRVCGVPINTDLELQAISDRVSSSPVLLNIPAEIGVARANPILDAAAVRTAVFVGVVMADSSSRILPGAEIRFPDLGLTARTNASGEFRLADIPPGAHKIVARAVGYMPLETELNFAANQTDERTLRLSRFTVLDSVVTTAAERRMNSFEENRRVGLGKFLTREDLERMRGRSMSSVMGEFNGLKLLRSPRTNAAWATRSRGVQSLGGAELIVPESGQPACYALVWIDGVPVYKGIDGEPLFDLNSIYPDEIEALEYYAGPAQTPPKYSGLKSSCGVIVIWRRR